MDKQLLDDVKDFVSRHSGVSFHKLFAPTRLREELYVNGDHAREMMQAFEREFGVDMSAFHFADYFAPSSWNPLVAIGNLFSPKDLKTLMISDLEQAARLGKWIENRS